MPALSVEDEQWMIHVLAVIAVVVTSFLISMHGIIGRVEVKEYLLRSTLLASLCEV